MPGRFPKAARAVIYPFLVSRVGGERCEICGKGPPERPLEIDHRDGNKNNGHRDNLRLLCKPCNVAQENRRRARPQRRPSDQTLSLSLSPPHTLPNIGAMVHHLADYKSGSAQMQARMFFWEPFTQWVAMLLSEHGQVTWDQIVYGSPNIIGCAPSTAEDMLKSLTSWTGPFIVVTDLTGAKAVQLRQGRAGKGPNE